MHTDRPLRQSLAKQNAVHIGILLAAGLAIGIYLIVTTVVISRDGITFIEFAQNLETSPTETIMREYQHPGYPYMVLTVRRITQIFRGGSTVFHWIYCAQATALAFRLLAMVMIYFLGGILVGPKPSFLAVLLLILFPTPAEYGSDALSDWPHMCFLVAAMFSSIHGAMKGDWWLFGLAGVFAGAGYLIRPECAQLVMYGFLWLILQMFRAKRAMSRPRLAFAIAALIISFAAFAVPYMYIKGAIFPKKNLGEFASGSHIAGEHDVQPRAMSDLVYVADISPLNIAKGIRIILSNIGETVMWIFVPAMLVGLYDSLKHRRQGWCDPRQFFLAAVLVSNVILMLWLYTRHGYMSKRHTLPIVVILSFYIWPGLQVLVPMLCGIVTSCVGRPRTSDCRNGALYFVLIVVGVSVCIPKLLRPIHHDKMFIRKASQWLAENTEPDDVVAVPDLRISFYAGRKGVLCDEHTLPEEVRYVVNVAEAGGEVSIDKDVLQIETSIDDEKGNPRAIIYSRAN